MTGAEREARMRERLAEMKRFENSLNEEGVIYVAGVDEAGRGPLAGPVVAACVVLSPGFDVPGIDDSKKLTEKRRNEMIPVIRENALAYGVGRADEKIIDRINILEATKGAMRTAVVKASQMLMEREGAGIQHILVDAVRIPGTGIPQTPVVKGDSMSVSIAAASILAKVTRDAIMVRYAEEYPWYGFEKNKGYGTKAHYDGIREHGICPIHRRSFLRNFDEKHR